MKSKDKIFLILGILLLVLFIYQVNSAYAKYINAFNDGAKGDFAKWNIKIKNEDIVHDIENQKVFKDIKATIIVDQDADASDKFFSDDIFAPGRFGFFEFEIDYSDVTVPFTYEVFADNKSGNKNIIEYIRVIETEENEAQVLEYLNRESKSPLDVDNPLKKQILPEEENRVTKLRVYIIWKESNNTTGGSYVDNISSGSSSLTYTITFKFNQFDPDATVDPGPGESGEDIEPLDINGRENILDSDEEGSPGYRKISFGDKVTLNGESFYVIDVSERYNIVKLLAEYNLNVGNGLDENGTFGIQNNICTGAFSSFGIGSGSGNCTVPFYRVGNSQNNTPIPGEGEEISGDSTLDPQPIPFAGGPGGLGGHNGSTSYWSDRKIPYPSEVYTTQTYFYQYVLNYQDYIKASYPSAEASVLLYDDVIRICGDSHSCTSAPDWFRNTSFWTGSAANETYVWNVMRNGRFLGKDPGLRVRYDEENLLGVRPVIVIKAIEI